MFGRLFKARSPWEYCTQCGHPMREHKPAGYTDGSLPCTHKRILPGPRRRCPCSDMHFPPPVGIRR